MRKSFSSGVLSSVSSMRVLTRRDTKRAVICMFFCFCFSVSLNAEAGFKRVDKEKGWYLYHDKERNVYLQLIDTYHAKLTMHCLQYTYRENDCINHFMPDHWNFFSDYHGAYSVVNGQYFDRGGWRQSSKLALPVSSGINGEMIGNGYEQDIVGSKFQGKLRTLQLGFRYGTVHQHYDKELIKNSLYGGIVGGSPDVSEDDDAQKIGRTMIGVWDYKNRSKNRKRFIMVLTARAMTKANAANILTNLGVKERDIVVLDGSGSTQMKTQNEKLLGSNGWYADGRPLPQVMIVNKR